MSAATPIFDSLLRQQIMVQRFASGEIGKVTTFLVQMDQAIRGELSAADELTRMQKSRLEVLLQSVDTLLGRIWERFRATLQGDLFGMAKYEASVAAQALDRSIKDFEAVVPSAMQIRAAATSSPLAVKGPNRGRLLADFIDDWTTSERRAVIGVIRRGAFEGMNNGDIVRAIRGTQALNYQDGLLDVTRRHADAVVRTSVQHVANVARTETLKANSDIIKAWQWVATLDKRTCPSCRSLDGRQFPPSMKARPEPPLHINCRCTLVPVLTDKFAKLQKGGTRASKGPEGGQQVASDLSYYEWLKQQPAAFQDDVLGPTRGKLFRDGGLSAARFAELQLDRYYQPITLDQMRDRNPMVFAEAGL